MGAHHCAKFIFVLVAIVNVQVLASDAKAPAKSSLQLGIVAESVAIKEGEPLPVTAVITNGSSGFEQLPGAPFNGLRYELAREDGKDWERVAISLDANRTVVPPFSLAPGARIGTTEVILVRLPKDKGTPFVFRGPGQYRLRAVHRGVRGPRLVSNEIRVTVALTERAKESEEKLAARIAVSRILMGIDGCAGNEKPLHNLIDTHPDSIAADLARIRLAELSLATIVVDPRSLQWLQDVSRDRRSIYLTAAILRIRLCTKARNEVRYKLAESVQMLQREMETAKELGRDGQASMALDDAQRMLGILQR